MENDLQDKNIGKSKHELKLVMAQKDEAET